MEGINLLDPQDRHDRLVRQALRSLSDAEKEHLLETIKSGQPITVQGRTSDHGVVWIVQASFRLTQDGEIEATSVLEKGDGGYIDFDG